MTWRSKKVWDQLVSGEDCPFCEDGHLEENPFSYLIAEMSHSYFRFTKAQDPAGLCSVVYKRHATELFHLNEDERNGFCRNIALAAAVVSQVFKPIKMHYGVFGSLCPHLHCHLMPKYLSDDPHAPITFGDRSKSIDSQTASKLLETLRRSLFDTRDQE